MIVYSCNFLVLGGGDKAVICMCVCFSSFEFANVRLFIPYIFMGVLNIFKLGFSF